MTYMIMGWRSAMLSSANQWCRKLVEQIQGQTYSLKVKEAKDVRLVWVTTFKKQGSQGLTARGRCPSSNRINSSILCLFVLIRSWMDQMMFICLVDSRILLSLVFQMFISLGNIFRSMPKNDVLPNLWVS